MGVLTALAGAASRALRRRLPTAARQAGDLDRDRKVRYDKGSETPEPAVPGPSRGHLSTVGRWTAFSTPQDTYAARVAVGRWAAPPIPSV